jgi:hypothetical protein
MVPESYKISFAALDAIWREYPTESLANLLSGMAINASGEMSMDPGALYDWGHRADQGQNVSAFDLMLAYLERDASLYIEVPSDLRQLIDALRTEATPERQIAEATIAVCKNGTVDLAEACKATLRGSSSVVLRPSSLDSARDDKDQGDTIWSGVANHNATFASCPSA